MDSQIWDKLLLLIAGGVLTALGAWLNDLRTERRRKRAKLEEAYLSWLNNSASVLGRLKELTKLAEDMPESLHSHELLLQKFALLSSELQNLTSALNLAFIYENDREKKALVEAQSIHYASLADVLSTIIQHHRTHLDFQMEVDKASSLVKSFEEMMKMEEVGLNSDLSKQILELYQKAKHQRDKASNHLSSCSIKLSTNAKEISKRIDEIETQSPIFRRALVE